MFNCSLNLRRACKTNAFRIMDGIFVGNYLPLEQQQYLRINQITHVVNCAASQIQVPTYLKELKFYWKDEDQETIVSMSTIEEIFIFVEKAIGKGECVLFCCLNGQSRSLTALVGYLMYKYQWSLFKVLQFIDMLKADFEIRATFLKQLMIFEQKDMKNMVISRNWNQTQKEEEQVLLQNTYLNSVQIKKEDLRTTIAIPKRQNDVLKKVSWSKNLIQSNIIDVQFESSNVDREVKSILKIHNPKRQGKNNYSSKVSTNLPTQQSIVAVQDLFQRKNSQQTKRIKQRTLSPIKENRIKNQTIQIPNFQNKKYIDIQLQFLQVQNKYRSQTNTPRLNKKSRNQENLNNSCCSAINDLEKVSKSPFQNRKAQLKLACWF